MKFRRHEVEIALTVCYSVHIDPVGLYLNFENWLLKIDRSHTGCVPIGYFYNDMNNHSRILPYTVASAAIPESFKVYVRRDEFTVQVTWPHLDADYEGATVMVTYVVERVSQGGHNVGPKNVNATAAAGGVTFSVQPGYTYRYDVIIVDQGRVVFKRDRILEENTGRKPV